MNTPYQSSRNQAETKTLTGVMAAAAARCAIGVVIVKHKLLIG